jgi:hypothetical protein
MTKNAFDRYDLTNATVMQVNSLHSFIDQRPETNILTVNVDTTGLLSVVYSTIAGHIAEKKYNDIGLLVSTEFYNGFDLTLNKPSGKPFASIKMRDNGANTHAEES